MEFAAAVQLLIQVASLAASVAGKASQSSDVQTITRYVGVAADLATKAQQLGAIVSLAQKENRPFTAEEVKAMQALDDEAAKLELAAIERAEAAAKG